MPLSVLVGIFNTGKTFPFALCFITSESAATFEFMDDQLDDIIFHDCERPRVICGDFAKRLASAIATKKAKDHAEGKPSSLILQLCKWHGVEAINRRLIAAGQYPKEKREKILDLIWKWVKSYTLEELESNRATLLESLLDREKEYLITHYQFKEHQFVRAYTRTYPNLSANSTQRSESYHAVIKPLINRQMSLADSVRRIRDYIQQIGTQYDQDINRDQKGIPRLLDSHAFADIKFLLTHFCLGLFNP